jgi:cytochrome c oxidase subunit II
MHSIFSKYIRLKTVAQASLASMALSGVAVAEELAPQSWHERSSINMRPGVTEISKTAFDLHMNILWICVVIGLAVFGLMFYSMWAHRKSRGHKAADFHESTKLEIAWTVIPFLIVIWMAVMATGTLVKMYDTSASDLTIKVTGSQWKWHYEYMNYGDKSNLGVAFYSVLSTPREQYDQRHKVYGRPVDKNYLLEVDNALVIPKDKKVRFLVTSNDVIHAWWVPDFGIKKDAIPGFVNELWTRVPTTGVYAGQCTELCGKDHGFMPIVVKVVEQNEFDTWLAEKQAAAAAGPDTTAFTSMAEAVAAGKEVFTGRCAACHGMNGEGGIGAKLTGGAIATGPVKNHLKFVINGSPKNPMMAAYGNQLSAKELAAVVTYERNALGNSTGDLVQPADVESAK